MTPAWTASAATENAAPRIVWSIAGNDSGGGAGLSADARAAEYIYLYASTGSVGLIQRWLADGMRETPAEMAALVSALVSRGMSAFYEKQP